MAMAAMFICVGMVLPVKQASAETFSFCGPSGGTGGGYFADNEAEGLYVVEVRVWYGTVIDAVQFVYEDEKGMKIEGTKHGGNGGALSIFKLQPGETIAKISGKYSSFVDSMQLLTSNGRERQWGGSGGTVSYTYSAPPGSSISGLFGRYGIYIDALGVIFSTP